jgi:NADPH-dependent 2,4-dienoyl-CoA reductase/sulfur reductase-like enzyme/ferredoxin
MPKLRIDNRQVEVEPGATVLDAARKLGLAIPSLCYRSGCTANTSCLCCVVKVNGSSRLVPSCATKAADGMIVESETPEVRDARRLALELLLADHAGDCLAPCTNVCPAHMDIPTMIRQISAGELHEALATVKEMIALPAVLGRICPELCEKGCRRGAMDSPVSICRLKRHVADVDLASANPYLPPRLSDSGKRVVVVGTGPTGLAAAWYLLQHGHRVVLFDDHPLPGGNLRYAVPREKLPHEVLDAEISLIRKLGAEFQLSIRVGRHVPLPELRGQFDAVLLAVGEVDQTGGAALGLELAAKGIKANAQTMMTAIDGVFVAGAAVAPFRYAVRAVAEGREASSVIDLYLRGRAIVPHAPRFTVRLGVLNPDELAAFTATAPAIARAGASNHAGLGVEEARRESARCLNCDCDKLRQCALRQVSIAYNANPTHYRAERRPFERILTHPSIIYEPGKCIACGLCVQIAEKAREPLGLTFIGRGFSLKVSVPFDRALSEALGKVAEECAEACPTGALVLRRSKPRPPSI